MSLVFKANKWDPVSQWFVNVKSCPKVRRGNDFPNSKRQIANVSQLFMCNVVWVEGSLGTARQAIWSRHRRQILAEVVDDVPVPRSTPYSFLWWRDLPGGSASTRRRDCYWWNGRRRSRETAQWPCSWWLDRRDSTSTTWLQHHSAYTGCLCYYLNNICNESGEKWVTKTFCQKALNLLHIAFHSRNK